MTEVEDIAANTRTVFETILKSSLGHMETAGTCLYAAALCAMLINKFTGSSATVRGGDGDADGGLFIDGVGHGHYWVSVITDGITYVVDITGDQFGLEPVIVAELDALPANYVPGCQITVDAHMQMTLEDLRL